MNLPAGFIAALSSAKDQQELLAATAEWVPRTIQAGLSSLSLPNDRTSLKIMKLNEGESTIIPSGSVYPIVGSMIGNAYMTGEVVAVDDLRLTSYPECALLLPAGIRSALIGPMMSGGRCLGTINLGNLSVGHYNERHRLLLDAIGGLVGAFLNVLQLAADSEQRATFDELTGAMTRRAGLEMLEDRYATGWATSLSIIYLDLDNFKSINDSHGHQLGDEMLRIVARRIQGVLGSTDQLVRMGGDEFLVILNDDVDGTRAERVAEAIRDALTMPVKIRSLQIEPRASLGIAHSRHGARTTFELMGDADQAMYDAKGGAGIVVADESIQRRATLIAAIDRELDAAMNDGSLCFHYQPIHDLATGELAGAEALVRWEHARHGSLPAPLIVERIEATGRVDRFTQWSLRTAAGDLQRLKQALPRFAGCGIWGNYSPRQLACDRFADLHATTCDLYGLDRHELVVEIVESDEIRPGDAAEHTLHKLHEAGAFIALDDFGTGHNALGYFTRLPIDACKFDRSLVGVMATNAAAHTMLDALTTMVHDLGVAALAEGVETEIEENMSRAAGVTLGQGWHFGRPMPLGDLIAREVRDRPMPTAALHRG